MHTKFHLNACIKLQPQKDHAFNFCEVGAEVDSGFIVDLKTFYSKIVTFCVKKMDTIRLNVISIKLMPIGGKIKITANVILAKEQAKAEAEAKAKADAEVQSPLAQTDLNLAEKKVDPYRKIEFTEDEQQLGIYRLFKYMEVQAMQQKGSQFHSLVHVRIVPVEKEDVSADKF